MPDFVPTVLRIMQVVTSITLALIALFAVTTALLATGGVLPWLQIEASFGQLPAENSGVILQLIFTALVVGICFFIPSGNRMLTLETSHRRFQLQMDDVARAYALAHQADRDGTFALSAEFDSIRERLDYLRRHPDLGQLEPEILEIAAQMSHESRELASIYSEEKVTRARAFLTVRQQEAATYENNIRLARSTCTALRNQLQDVESAERNNESLMQVLKKDMREIMPLIGYEMVEKLPNVLNLPLAHSKPKA